MRAFFFSTSKTVRQLADVILQSFQMFQRFFHTIHDTNNPWLSQGNKAGRTDQCQCAPYQIQTKRIVSDTPARIPQNRALALGHLTHENRMALPSCRAAPRRTHTRNLQRVRAADPIARPSILCVPWATVLACRFANRGPPTIRRSPYRTTPSVRRPPNSSMILPSRR